jgi:hypothetical protein
LIEWESFISRHPCYPIFFDQLKISTTAIQSMIMQSRKTNHKTYVALFIAAAATLSISQAELFTYTDGNLILGFQATAGTGSTRNVFFDLGPATGFRDSGNQGVLGNIGTTLAAVYGSNWYAREDLYFGVIANLNQQPNSGFGARNPVNGDPSRTFYISAAAASPGAGLLFPAETFPASSLGTSGTSLSGLENVLKPTPDGTGWISGSPDPLAQGLQKEPDGTGILEQTLTQHAVAWNNSWTRWNPSPGAAFDVFTGGIQQNFGKGGAATYVDVQRILAYSTGASPAGIVGGGTYETTISIGSSGSITAQAATTSTPFQTWVLGFPLLDTEAKRLLSADPDSDGSNNLEEFAFGGDPSDPTDQGTRIVQTVDANGDTRKDLTLTLEVRSGASFSLSSNDQVSAAIDELTYRIEGSTDLVNWNSTVSEVSPLGSGSPSTGYIFKTFRLDAGNGLSGRGVLRASVTQ